MYLFPNVQDFDVDFVQFTDLKKIILTIERQNHLLKVTSATLFSLLKNDFNLECTVMDNLLGTPRSFTIYFH